MPDKDLFQRTFAPGWLRVYRLARDGAGDDSEIRELKAMLFMALVAARHAVPLRKSLCVQQSLWGAFTSVAGGAINLSDQD
jgi:hypothetical protein